MSKARFIKKVSASRWIRSILSTFVFFFFRDTVTRAVFILFYLFPFSLIVLFRYIITNNIRSSTLAIPYYSERHMVSPGIAGWAQINYRYGNSIEDTRQKLMYDFYEKALQSAPWLATGMNACLAQRVIRETGSLPNPQRPLRSMV